MRIPLFQRYADTRGHRGNILYRLKRRAEAAEVLGLEKLSADLFDITEDLDQLFHQIEKMISGDLDEQFQETRRGVAGILTALVDRCEREEKEKN